MLDRWEIFEHRPPQERQQLRDYYGQMRDLSPERRAAVRQGVRELGGMNPGERERMLNSPQFQRRYSPQERDMIRGLAQWEPSR